jgi:acetylglutamate kinase
MKQTAVEWLVEELSKKGDYGLGFYLEHKDEIIQAKEMEKEQMIDWYATGQADTVNMYEQHLNKTFNTTEK